MSAWNDLQKKPVLDRTVLDNAILFSRHGEVEEAAEILAAMQARIEKLETAASQAVAWLNHYPSPDNKEEQAESNRRRALNILEKALTK